MTQVPIGKRVRRQRESLGLTRAELAAKSKVSVRTLARLELESREPRLVALRSIAKALGVPLSDLIAETRRTVA